METQRICPSCRKPLPPDVPLGLCPECLIKSGFNTGTEPGVSAKESGFVPPPVEDLRKLFPQWEILELIGKGGMGAVYKARQPALDRLVALKILPPGAADDAGFAERFNREARALARLNHPHIVAVHDFGQAGRQPFVVMEFVDGLNLRQVEQAGRLTPEQALHIVPQICEALQFAHNEGVVHRDIKPENILLDKKGRVKITDFGIAKIVGVPAGRVSLTGAKDVLGTPHYMAPEQVEKPSTVDHRADIYSLGVVFYELLTGELPLGKFPPPSEKVQVDVRLDEVVLHALEKEPTRRYQQAGQVKTDLETIAATPSSGNSGRESAPPKPARPPAPVTGSSIATWKPATAIIAAVIIVLAVPLGAYSLWFSAYRALQRDHAVPDAGSVVRVEAKLRREIVERLAEDGWKAEGLSVSVSPDLKRAECRFGRIWKNGLTTEPPPPAAIHFELQGSNLWLVSGDGEFQWLRFSVDTSAEMAASRQNPGLTAEPFQYAELEDSPPNTPLAALVSAPGGHYALTLPNGVACEVVAVTRKPAENKLWWKPDGTPLSAPPGARLEFTPVGMNRSTPNDEEDVAVWVRTTPPPLSPADARWQWRVTYSPRGESLGTIIIHQDSRVDEAAAELGRLGRRIAGQPGGLKTAGAVVGHADAIRFPPGTEEIAVQCSAAAGPWEPVAVFDGKQTRVLVQETQVLCTHPRQEANGRCLDVTHNVDREQFALRMVGVCKDGRRHEVGLHSGVLSARETQGFVMLDPGQRAADIAQFVLERTPWVRGEIRGVLLTPREPRAAPPAQTR